jgi:nucleotide-binding universal stress UspA family protein
MFGRILVALDGLEKNSMVVDAAIKLAKVMNAELRCCHAISLSESDFPGYYPLGRTNISNAFDVGFVVSEVEYEAVLKNYAKERQNFEQRHLNFLREITQDAITSGISTDYCLVYGDPGKQICQIASEWQADTIVIGRRGYLGLKELWLGSVSNYVLHHAACTVLVIQGEEATKLKPDTAMDLSHV